MQNDTHGQLCVRKKKHNPANFVEPIYMHNNIGKAHCLQLFLAWILILFLQSHCPYIRTVVRSSSKQKDPVNNKRKVFMEQKSLSNCDRKFGLIGVNLDLRVTRLPRGLSL